MDADRKFAELTKLAETGFSILRRDGEIRRSLSIMVAQCIGMEAARLRFTEKELTEWLKINYGKVWVRMSGLKPGIDMKELRKEAFTWYANTVAKRKN